MSFAISVYEFRRLATIIALSFYSKTVLYLLQYMQCILSSVTHLSCSSALICRIKNPLLEMPDGYHCVDHCIEILEEKMDYVHVKLHERAKARSGLSSVGQDDSKKKMKGVHS